MTARLDFKGALACQQGATFVFRACLADGSTYVAQDLAGMTAVMVVKSAYGDTVEALRLTTENGGIALGLAAGPVPTKASASAPVVMAASSGGILITASASLTALLPVAACGRHSPPVQSYVYDLVLISSGIRTRQLFGDFDVVAGVAP